MDFYNKSYNGTVLLATGSTRGGVYRTTIPLCQCALTGRMLGVCVRLPIRMSLTVHTGILDVAALVPSVGKSDGSTVWSDSMPSLPITGGFTSLTRTRCMMCLLIMFYQNDSTWSIGLGAQGPGLQTTSEINVRTVVGISISPLGRTRCDWSGGQV